MRAALESAGATNLAALETVLARGYDGGTDLSGGQWQRVALARALAAVTLGAGVVLLDEPTAQLDVRGEAEIFERHVVVAKGGVEAHAGREQRRIRLLELRDEILRLLTPVHVVAEHDHELEWNLRSSGGHLLTDVVLRATARAGVSDCRKLQRVGS